MILVKVISITLLCICVTSYGFQINIKRKGYAQIGDIKISEQQIHDRLRDHEKELLFGKIKHRPELTLVHVSHIKPNRSKRSTDSIVTIKLEDNEEQVDLKLHQTSKLIDDAFILIRRYENSSQFIENSHQLAANYEKCFYRNENSALDLCDETIRGIFHHNSSDFLIHPLPPRFGKNSHIIFKPKNGFARSLNNENAVSDETIEDKNEDIPTMVNDIHFEPDFDEFNANGSELSAKTWSFIAGTDEINNADHTCPVNENDDYEGSTSDDKRKKRHISTQWKIPQVLHIETAIFVDKDLFKHMAKNFPDSTESQLIRFVLAMVNGVQLLYHHPSLGHQINFVLKRLEILHSDPAELRRSSNIDMFLNNFCVWQQKLNPPSDSDVVHYDHAVILTGLDLYVVAKNGKVSSQVVGLAPVAGMCIPTSSCTINEGKHFESVFVVAHEIGHNLGMRHDSNEFNCDPSLYIMSPTLGSGKITWSKCSRSFLNTFLETTQSHCMFDRGQFGNNLDHSAEGILPGERFDADQQCMLKYGKDSTRSRAQPLTDICRDLHCQRERYTWTSHPALEGTECGEMMWCRSGVCVLRAALMESFSIPKQVITAKQYDKVNFVDDKKFANLMHEYNFNKPPTWSEWSQPSDCDSGCLYGPSGRLREGSTGLKIYTRTCLDYKRRCTGRDKKYEACIAKQCYTITKTTINDFATQICERAKKFDSELTGEGLQNVSESVEDACKVYCRTNTNGTKSRSWTFPEGTTCRTTKYDLDDTAYCINGRCEKFTCENSTRNYYKMDSSFCPQSLVEAESQHWNSIQQENGRDYKRFRSQNKIEDVTERSFQAMNDERIVEQKPWSRHPHAAKLQSAWIVKSGCHFSCMDQAKGIQIVSSAIDNSNNIQLCSPTIMPCDKFQTTIEYSQNICSRYKLKVRGLSGYGMQIAPSVQDPDRSCRVACQDEQLPHRFYLVNGEQGLFPFGTKCSQKEERYCVNGKCLEFGTDNIPLTRSYISLALFRSRRDTTEFHSRHKRSFLYYKPINISEEISQQFLDNLIHKLNFQMIDTTSEPFISNEHIEFTNPIHLSIDNDELIDI